MAEARAQKPLTGLGTIDVLRGLRRPGRRRRTALLSGLWLSVRLVVSAITSLFAFRGLGSGKYVKGATLSVLANVLAASAYMAFMPPQFTSRWTLILPTASSGSSLQLESIGHAQTIPSSPFGSASMSPKVIYKEIFNSEPVRLEAAEAIGFDVADKGKAAALVAFGSPRIKLIDETSLMLFEVSDSTAVAAQRKGEALIAAFHRQLDALRRDEIARRAEVVETSLTQYRQNLTVARNRILEQQRETGVVSINQFNDAATTLELLRRKRIEVLADYDRSQSERQSLIARLDVPPEVATLALRLCADQAFVKIATEYADANALYQQERLRLGEANPILLNLKRRLAAAEHEIQSAIPGASATVVAKVPLLINGSQQSDLFKSIIASEAQTTGKHKELAALDEEIDRLTRDVKRMSVDAARLEDLKKDHLVAEAVFTSALARIDTNKTDIYASYPMVQTLAPPDLPDRKSSPRLLFAIIGAGLGSVLSIVAWGLAWLRDMFSPKRSKNA